jgi:16S rRNA (adenine1518-N6/adenine1519-N6)-dimethyltransferase
LIPARKRWGQHFLVRPETARRIVEASRVGPDDTAFEVGPGEGALTRPLAELAGRVLAVEIDPLRVEALERELADLGNLRLLRGDVLDRSFAAWLGDAGWAAPAVLVSNLPYNAATPILLRAAEEEGTFSRAIATVQKEVARRFAAKPGEEGYGYLSVRTAAFARARLLFDLPAGAFRPPPKVTSSVIELVPRFPRLEPLSRERALLLASLAFRSRRKTAANAISAASAAGRSSVVRALEDVGFDPRARAGELSLDHYLALADRIDFGPAASRER